MTRDAAVAAAARGWAVFPLEPGYKKATLKDWPNRACADPELVARYWPSDQHNIGIACGPSRLVVVDLDIPTPDKPMDAAWRELPGIEDGKDVFAWIVEAAGMDWPYTYTVATPSGGWHLYFTGPDGCGIRNSASLIGPKVDVRADGGYVVGAGSVTPGGAYEVLYDEPAAPLPPWIARLAGPRAELPNGVRHFAPAGQPSKRLDGLLRTVGAAKPGTRNDTLFWAASRAAEMAAAGEVAGRDAAGQLLAAASSAGLSEQESVRTIASAMKGTR